MRGPRSHCDGLFIPRVIWIIARGERCCCLSEWEFQNFYFRVSLVRSYISCSLPSPAPYNFDKFDSSPDWQMSPLNGGSPRPCLLTYQRRYSNDKQLSSVVMLRDMMTSLSWMTNITMMRLLRLGQLEMGNKIKNFTVNASLQVLKNHDVPKHWMCDGVKLSWRCFQIVKWSDNWWYKTWHF